MKMRKMLQYRLADLDSMLVLLFAFLQPISAQKADDNVHILQCNDDTSSKLMTQVRLLLLTLRIMSMV